MDDTLPRLEDVLGEILNQRLRSANTLSRDHDLSLAQRYRLYASRFHTIDFLEKRSFFRRFHDEFAWAARFAAPERDQVLCAVVRQAVDYGLPYVLSQVSPEAVTFRRWAMQIRRELCKARGLIRLVPTARERWLVGRWRFRSFLVAWCFSTFSSVFPTIG